MERKPAAHVDVVDEIDGRYPTLSSAALLVSNLIPLCGVLLWGWDVFAIIFLFWSENVIVGVFNVLKMAIVKPQNAADFLLRFFLIPFFIVHYGIFTMVHGMFVFVLFSGIDMKTLPDGGGGAPWNFLFTLVSQRVPSQLLIGFAALFASHAVSFVANYLIRGEFRITTLQELMMRPYGRIVVLHLTIMAGGFAVMALHAPQMAIAVLVVIKTAIDLKAHLTERKKFGMRAGATVVEDA